MKPKHIAPGITTVYSKTLGEHIYFVSGAYRHIRLAGVIYTFEERLLLRGVTKKQLNQIHQVKKLFGGELIDADKYKW